MSLIIPKNYKRANAQDAVARVATSDELNVGDKIWITQYGRGYPYTITKKWKEGWTVWYKAKNDKSGKEEVVAGAFANALDAADSIADKEREYTRLYELAQKNITFHAAKGDSAKVAEWKRKADEYKRLAQEAENAAGDAADSRAAGDATTRKFKPNDLVEWRDAHGRHNSAFYVRDNGDRVTVSIEKNGQGGGLEIPKAWITNSRAADAGDAADAELNNNADLRAAVAKMADIAKRLTGANVSFKAGWTPEGVGEISIEFPDSESARRYNYYKLFNAWEAAENQITPRWATGFSGFKVPRVDGNRMTISVLHFTT